jgi:hypothetical protein
MNKAVFFAAPLLAAALVAGCKGNSAPAADASASAAALTDAAAALPTLSANAKTGGAFAGSYSQTGADGKVTTLKLAADDTYEWTGADGKVVKGGFTWYRDGSTILLDAAGGKAVYALADGGVYKLADNAAPRTGLTAEQLWTKAAQ